MKHIKHCMLVLLAALYLFMGTVSAYEVPEAYMGFSVSENWYVFSKNMENKKLLDAVGLSSEQVNKALVKSDCAYFLTNPKDNCEMYVKVKKTALAEEYYNIFVTEDAVLKQDIGRILKEGFFMEDFSYDPNQITVTPYAQMKFITVPGTVQYDGAQHGMLFGATFVNGTGIAFLMYLEESIVTEANISAYNDVISTVNFTVIKEKDVDAANPNPTEEKSQSGLSYIAGGLGGLALVALCYYMIERIKKSENSDKDGNDQNVPE